MFEIVQKYAKTNNLLMYHNDNKNKQGMISNQNYSIGQNI